MIKIKAAKYKLLLWSVQIGGAQEYDYIKELSHHTEWAAFDSTDDRKLAWDAYCGSLDAAVGLVESVLPGWYWRVAECHLSSDAWVAPDFNCTTHGARLQEEVPPMIHGEDWHSFTDVDVRPSGNPARALLISALIALIALDRD